MPVGRALAADQGFWGLAKYIWKWYYFNSIFGCYWFLFISTAVNSLSGNLSVIAYSITSWNILSVPPLFNVLFLYSLLT